MGREYFVHPDDVQINRNDREWPTKAVCYDDSDGGFLHCFPLSMSDEQIMEAICFANKVYKIGLQQGKAQKMIEIRSVLGLE